jgi:hypothetical protein
MGTPKLIGYGKTDPKRRRSHAGAMGSAKGFC